MYNNLHLDSYRIEIQILRVALMTSLFSLSDKKKIEEIKTVTSVVIVVHLLYRTRS